MNRAENNIEQGRGKNVENKPENGTKSEDIKPRKKKKAQVPLSEELLKLFQNQELEVSGELSVKTSRLQIPKRFYIELREATLVAFRSVEVVSLPTLSIEDVVYVFSVPMYTFDIQQKRKDDGDAWINISWPNKKHDTVMYIKVDGGTGQLDAWRHGLAKPKQYPLPSLKSLTIESVIGRGGGGKVFLVSWNRKDISNTYALKVIDKEQAFKGGKTFRHMSSERLLMEKIAEHPFILRMQFAFQTQKNLFIGTPFCIGGDLAAYLRAKGDRGFPCNGVELAEIHLEDQRKRRVYGRLTEVQTRLILAEVILGLEHLHESGVVYRDLKPENIFIDNTGHVKIGDYGLAKYLAGRGKGPHLERTESICGTRNYLPPEMLFEEKYSYEADIWTLGVVLYRMLCGALPFEAQRTRDLFKKIKRNQVIYPSWLSHRSSDLIQKLLNSDPSKRPGFASIKTQPFFDNINWDDVFNRRMGPSIPDFEPHSGSSCDPLENFELSKLQGITVGEYDLGVDGELGESIDETPTHERSTKNMVIGFEYCCPIVDKVTPLDVTKRPGGILSTLTSPSLLFKKRSSAETQALSTRRSSSDVGFFSKLASIDLPLQLLSPKGIQSPRGYEPSPDERSKRRGNRGSVLGGTSRIGNRGSMQNLIEGASRFRISERTAAGSLVPEPPHMRRTRGRSAYKAGQAKRRGLAEEDSKGVMRLSSGMQIADVNRQKNGQ